MKLKYYLRGLGAGILISTIILSVAMGKSEKVDLTDDEIIERAETLGMEMKSSGVNVDYDAINESLNGSKMDEESDDTQDTNSENTEAEDFDESSEDETLSNDSSNTSVNQASTEHEESSVDSSKNQGADNKTGNTSDTGALNQSKEENHENSEIESGEDSSSTQENESENSDNLQPDSSKAEDSIDISDATEESLIEELPVTKSITIRPGMTAKQVCQLLEDQGVIASADSFNLYLLENSLTGKIISQKIEIEVNSDYKTIAALITEQ